MGRKSEPLGLIAPFALFVACALCCCACDSAAPSGAGKLLAGWPICPTQELARAINGSDQADYTKYPLHYFDQRGCAGGMFDMAARKVAQEGNLVGVKVTDPDAAKVGVKPETIYWVEARGFKSGGG
jgi:hypothetical protein